MDTEDRLTAEIVLAVKPLLPAPCPVCNPSSRSNPELSCFRCVERQLLRAICVGSTLPAALLRLEETGDLVRVG